MKQYSEDELRNNHHLAEAFVKESPQAAAMYLRNALSDNINLRYYVQGVTEKRSNNGEWWVTYRAALTGLYACGAPADDWDDWVHDKAVAAANKAHGPLEEILPYKEPE